MSRCMLIESGLPKSMWNYGLRTAVYIRNGSICNLNERTPFEKFYRKVPNICNMHKFGNECYAYIEKKRKLDPRSEKGIFVGYDTTSPAYLVYFPDCNDLKRVRVVKFFKDSILPNKTVESLNCEPQSSEMNINENYNIPECLNVPGNFEPNTINVNLPAQDSEKQSESGGGTVRRSGRQRNPPEYLSEYEMSGDMLNTLNFYHCYSVSYEDSMQSDQAHECKNAMEEEMNAFKLNKVYEECTLPPGKSSVGGRWVLTLKEAGDGVHYEARYVAKGYTQLPNVDFIDSLSPTARILSVRILIQLASS